MHPLRSKNAVSLNSFQLTRRDAVCMILAAIATPSIGCRGGASRSSGGSTTAPIMEDSRPQYHLTPPSEWINDPQRPLWFNNQWNLWVLWNGDYPTGNGTAWRRYTSTDLVTWKDKGISIPKYTTIYGDCWTGSALVDSANTTGYGAGAVIALMTMPCDRLGGQSTGLWYSNDGGASFQFGSIVQANPLAGNTSIADPVFRDPCVFWHTDSRRWIMSLAEVGKLSIYSSSDLRTWKYESAIIRSDLGTMECPHLFQLHLYHADGTKNGDKWVLLCGANGASSGFTTGTYYWVGEFDGSTFTPDSADGRWLDGGPDFYATTVFADGTADDPLAHAYAIAWMNNWNYAKLMRTNGYFGQLSIVRRLTLQMVQGVPILLSVPLAAQNTVFRTSVSGTNQTISDATAYNWPSGASAASCRIDCTLSPVNGAWPKGVYLSVRGGDGYFTQVGFDPGASTAFLKRDTCGPQVTTNSSWLNKYSVPCTFGSSVSVSVFVDVGSIEVYLNEGEVSLSGLITAPVDAISPNLTASGGSVAVSNVSIRVA